ncbi:MAG: sulfatase-like hydrolase/transferase, partial [Kofleriaceae bacterium]
MIRLSPLLAIAALCACGKSKDHPTAEPKVGEATVAAGGGPAAKPPAVPPAKAAARGAEHAVYSFVDNRIAAHLHRGGGLMVDGGSAGFAKYTRIPNQLTSNGKRAWELRQSEGDVKVARMTGKSATVFVPLTAQEASRPTIRLRAFVGDDATISLKVNDNKDINGKLTKGWTTVELSVPADQLKEGENAITVFAKKSGLELAWMQVGGAAAPADETPRFFDAGSKSLLLPKQAGMSWFVAVPDKAKLTGDLSDGACTVNVVATTDDGRVVEGKLTGTGSAFDLAALAGKAARIDLEGAGCPETSLANVALVVPGEVAKPKRGEPPKFVVFIIMDSLRADRVKAFNPKARPETPNWEKLAETSAVFMNTYVQGNESQVSHASIWSSNYLAKHRAIEMKDHLAEKWTT